MSDGLSDYGLSNLLYSRARHTWSNLRVGDRRISEKIDRILVNDAWLDLFSDSRAVFDCPDVSDHSPCRVFIYEKMKKRRPPFRFKNVWCSEEGFLNFVEQGWYGNFLGNRQFRVAKKLRRVKKALRVWNRSLSSDIEAHIEQGRVRARQLYLDIEGDRGSLMISEEIRDVRRLLETNMGKLFTHISQQAKINWIKMGDETSSMFFKRYKARKSQSAILRLSDAEGRVLEETEEIRGHIVGFYEDLLGSAVEVVDLPFPAG